MWYHAESALNGMLCQQYYIMYLCHIILLYNAIYICPTHALLEVSSLQLEEYTIEMHAEDYIAS